MSMPPWSRGWSFEVYTDQTLTTLVWSFNSIDYAINSMGYYKMKNTNYMNMDFTVIPIAYNGVPASGSWSFYNMPTQIAQSIAEGMYVVFGVGQLDPSTILTAFQGFVRTNVTWFNKYPSPNAVTNITALSGTVFQYSLTKQGITIDLPKGTVASALSPLINALGISGFNTFGGVGDYPFPPTKIVAQEWFNALNQFTYIAQANYTYDPIKNFLNVYPTHKIPSQNYGDETQIPIPLTNLVEYPVIDGYTYLLTCSKLIDTNLIKFGDVIQVDTSLIQYQNVGATTSSQQGLNNAIQTSNFFVYGIQFSGQLRGGDNSWLQNITGVLQE